MSRNSIGLSYPIRLGQDGFFETNVDTISQLKSNIKTLFSTKTRIEINYKQRKLGEGGGEGGRRA